MSKTQNYTVIATLMQTISNTTNLFIHLKNTEYNKFFFLSVLHLLFLNTAACEPQHYDKIIILIIITIVIIFISVISCLFSLYFTGEQN